MLLLHKSKEFAHSNFFIAPPRKSINHQNEGFRCCHRLPVLGPSMCPIMSENALDGTTKGPAFPMEVPLKPFLLFSKWSRFSRLNSYFAPILLLLLQAVTGARHHPLGRKAMQKLRDTPAIFGGLRPQKSGLQSASSCTSSHVRRSASSALLILVFIRLYSPLFPHRLSLLMSKYPLPQKTLDLEIPTPWMSPTI